MWRPVCGDLWAHVGPYGPTWASSEAKKDAMRGQGSSGSGGTGGGPRARQETQGTRPNKPHKSLINSLIHPEVPSLACGFTRPFEENSQEKYHNNSGHFWAKYGIRLF